MDALPPPSPSAVPPAPAVVKAWGHSAQLAAAFLLGLATALLGMHLLSRLPYGARPTEVAGTYRIDLNRASRAELLQLPGVGPGLVERIDAYRHATGGFRSVDELRQVQGVGPVLLEQVRPWVMASGPASPMAREVPSGGTEAPRPAAGRKEAQLTGRIDINRASAEELQRLPGIGPKLSQRLVEERSKGPFRSAEDLRRVSGIGPKTVERLRPYLTFAPEPIRLATVD